MRNKILSAILLVILVFIKVEPVWAAVPKIYATSAILMDCKSGEILFEKNAREKRPPASTTKILTAILALEMGQPDQLVTVSERAAMVGEATIYLDPGDQLTVMDLIHGALLKSGNDACVALAEGICPSEEEFINLMNLKAKIIGALDTTFYNTNGLPHKHHLTTAYDLALIARYAMNNPIFAEIVQKKHHTISWTKPNRKMYLKNTNKLLWEYPLATGVKTGTTDNAGKCLVAAGKYQEHEVIAVILNSPDRFGDARRLLDYGLKEKGA